MKRICREREMSLAELIRRGAEYIKELYPPLTASKGKWRLPDPLDLGKPQAPPEEWRRLAYERSPGELGIRLNKNKRS